MTVHGLTQPAHLGQLRIEESRNVLAVAAEVSAQDDCVDGLIGQERIDETRVHGQVGLPCPVEVDRIVDVTGLRQILCDPGACESVKDGDAQTVGLGSVCGDRALPA